MNPGSHFLLSWTVANAASISRRDRILVTLSGVVPDVDGAGIVAQWLTEDSATPRFWYGEFHHVLGHNAGFALVLVTAVVLLADRRWVTGFLAFMAFHLHLLGDLVGSRGPDGYQWPIPYLLPFSTDWNLTWQYQWELNAWPNFVITALLLGVSLRLSWRRGHSPLEVVSRRADAAFVSALRRRFGEPSDSCPSECSA
jgi:hypothetical protein